MTRRRWPALAAAVAGAGAIGLVLAFQGWASRGPDFDVTPAIARAVALVERGRIPSRGTLTDLNSYFPPGTTWIAAPAVVLFRDPRHVELFAAAMLYVLTLAGIALVARRCFGTAVAVLAIVLYAWSQSALTLAAWLWPRAHPVFYVWMAYFALRWIDARRGVYLAAALLVWAFGMYVHFELAPAILMLPAVWIVYRPPINWPAIAAATALIVAMWSPYLAFEQSRGFIDIKSQVLLRSIDDRGIERIEGCGEEPAAHPVLLPFAVEAHSIPERAGTLTDLLLANLSTRVPGGEFALLALLSGAAASAFRGRAAGAGWTTTRQLAAAGVLVASVMITEVTLRWVVDPASSAAAVLTLMRRANILAVLIAPWLMQWRAEGEAGRPLLTMLAAPLSVLLLLAEIGGERRFIGLWPLEVILIAAAVIAIVKHLPARSPQRAAVVLIVVAIVAANLLVVKRLRDWRVNGWSGVAATRLLADHYRVIDCP